MLRDAIFNLQDMFICLNANPGAGINFALISEIMRAERKMDAAPAALIAIDPPTKGWIEGRVAPSAHGKLAPFLSLTALCAQPRRTAMRLTKARMPFHAGTVPIGLALKTASTGFAEEIDFQEWAQRMCQ